MQFQTLLKLGLCPQPTSHGAPSVSPHSRLPAQSQPLHLRKLLTARRARPARRRKQKTRGTEANPPPQRPSRALARRSPPSSRQSCHPVARHRRVSGCTSCSSAKLCFARLIFCSSYPQWSPAKKLRSPLKKETSALLGKKTKTKKVSQVHGV